MVTDKPAYDQLLDYLTSNRALFANVENNQETSNTIESIVEEEVSTQVIALCTQHEALEQNHRSVIIREIDGIVYDIQQILIEYWPQHATQEQAEFLHEFAGLIKNVFDSEVAALLD